MRIVVTVMMMLLCVAGSQAGQGPEWHAIAGGQTGDKGQQALAFLPNELWVYAGDSISWTFPTDENHSVTFLTPGQIRPFPPVVGCAVTPDGSTFDNSACVNSGSLAGGHTYRVTFPAAGNFKLVCLVHFDMTDVVHCSTRQRFFPTIRPSTTAREIASGAPCFRTPRDWSAVGSRERYERRGMS